RLMRRKLLLAFTGPWQRMHEASKIGLMSRAKSILFVAGGGNRERSMFVESANRREDRNRRAQIRARDPFVPRPRARPPPRTVENEKEKEDEEDSLLMAASIEKERLRVGAVDGGVATSGPAGAVAKERGVIDVADKNFAGSHRVRHLGVAFEAKIGIPFHEHFGVDGAVRVVANGAAFAQGGMFENEGPGLLAMAGGAVFIHASHGQAAGRFHDVHSVRVVALDATHFAFNDRVMLWKMELRPGFLVAPETGFGILSRVDDEFFQAAASGHGDVFASGAVAGFAAAQAGQGGIRHAQ